MDKLKRIFALVGAVLLVLLYVITFILSCVSSPAEKYLLTAIISATVINTLFQYANIFIVRGSDLKFTDNSENNTINKIGSDPNQSCCRSY